MSKNPLRVALLINVVSSYREGFYDRLFKRDDLAVTIYCQDKLRDVNLNTIHTKYAPNVHLVKYLSASQERLSWHRLPWKDIFTHYDVIFVEGNPRNLAHALISSLLRLAGKKVVLWTQAHSFSAHPITEWIRLFWSRFFKFILVYTDAEVEYLRGRGFSKNFIIGQNNGLDQQRIETAKHLWSATQLTSWQATQNIKNRTLLLSCARLVQKNQFHEFLQILPDIVAQVPDLLWCVIGSGPELSALEEIVRAKELQAHVYFAGGLFEESSLAPWFLSAKLFIHPAGIGLSLMHAFGYGLPVVTHSNASHHGPEFAAFKEGLSGVSYKEGDFTALGETIVKLLQDTEAQAKMKGFVVNLVRQEYNVDVMVERFIKIAQKAAF